MAKPYITTFREFAQLLVDVTKSDRDAVVIVSGDTGEGKTTAEVLSMVEVCRLVGVPFNPVSMLVYDKDEFNELLDSAPRFSPVGVDEAVGLFYSRDYQDSEQIALLKKLDRIRYRNLVMFLVIPSLTHIDKHIRDARVRYWIYVHSRKGLGRDGEAHAYIFEKEKNPFNPDPWNIKKNRYLFSQGKIHNSVNYIGEVYFRDVPDWFKPFLKDVKDLKRKRAEALEWSKAREKKKFYGRGDKISRGLRA